MEAWRRIFPLLLTVLLLFAASHSQDNLYRVRRVIDGDTITVPHDRKPEKIRLYGIEMPSDVQQNK